MLNITIDTCVWLELLKVDFNNEDNYLEELCFWIENKHIKHIVPTNIIAEWNRNKITYQNDIAGHFKKIETDNLKFFKHNTELSSTYKTEIIETNVQKRIERIDLILNSYSEKAPHNDTILKDAADRNLQTLAPNYKKDSFRDTVNILSLTYHLKSKGYAKSIFTSLNYKDFSVDGGKRFELHSNLISDFNAANLTYEYFGELKDFGTKLFNLLRKELAANSFQVYLKNKKDKEEAAALAVKKSVATTTITSPDADYLENIKYIDMILARKTPTAFEQELIKSLIRRHDSYKQYFLSNIGNNGLV
ncbi:MAG: PIN domain-containing protein [Candidatus Firestonebacteria bacterium]